MPTYPYKIDNPVVANTRANRVKVYYNGTEYWIYPRSYSTWTSAWQGLNWYQFPQDYTNPPRPGANAYSFYEGSKRHMRGDYWPSVANRTYEAKVELECCPGHWVPIYPDRYSWCKGCQAVFTTTPTGISVQYPPTTLIEGNYPWNGGIRPIAGQTNPYMFERGQD